jgi:hypothetical protein
MENIKNNIISKMGDFGAHLMVFMGGCSLMSDSIE